jgi:rare lipoprotein A
MRRSLRFPLLLVSAGLAGCSTPVPQAPPQPVPLATPAPPPAVPQAFFTQTGLGSYYGGAEDGKLTANGENFDHHDLTAAHRTLAFGTVVRVTNLDNGRSVKVRINDRGPHVKGRIIDVSTQAARELGMRKDGVVRVRVEAFKGDQESAGVPDEQAVAERTP